ncbi:MAG: hypothetical protein DI563_24595 [Variovorax paradoxus]|uniref:Uncharacterized protein n=1 Tax=Variovorax paradoxus TaxID=34073 RepID=A0A2W5PKV6_VARPD|nr:MAG: hypothetical protein DI563_24595 [Variovorax paradoxus]
MLGLGWVAAAGVYATAPAGPAGSATYSVVGGQTFAVPGGATGWQAQQIERVGGQGTLLIARFDDWLGALWHGRRLALTLGVAAMLAFPACRFVAGLVDETDFK